jgi:hypothetical protein
MFRFVIVAFHKLRERWSKEDMFFFVICFATIDSATLLMPCICFKLIDVVFSKINKSTHKNMSIYIRISKPNLTEDAIINLEHRPSVSN